MTAARRKASVMSLSDTSSQLYALFDDVTGHMGDEVGLAGLPSLTALLEIDEMSVDDYNKALKACNLSNMVVLYPDNEFHSSSLVNVTVLEST